MKDKTCIAVVYHSITGTTDKLAQAVLDGAAGVQRTRTLSVLIDGNDIHQGRYQNSEAMNALDAADAIVFGSPTFMGCVSAQFKAFADATSDFWDQQRWADKLAAGFTVGVNPGGDLLNTIQYLSIFANQHGMFWVSINLPGGHDFQGRNPMGAQSGLVSHAPNGAVSSADIATASYLGSRVASLANRLNQ